MAQHPSRRPRLLVALVVVAVVLGLLVAAYAAIALVFGGQVPQASVVATTCRQPDSVIYADGFAHSVFVLEPARSISLRQTHPRAVVGMDESYGVLVELSESIDPAKVECRWDAGGVEIIEPTGITHSVPASRFTGGR